MNVEFQHTKRKFQNLLFIRIVIENKSALT